MPTASSSRRKALWSGAATVAVLAVVLIGFGMFGPLSKSGKEAGSSSLTSPAQTSQTLYQQALAAQRSGDLTRTAALAQAAVNADPTNSAAKALVALVAQQTASPTAPSNGGAGSGSGATPQTTPASRTASSGVTVDPAFFKPIRNLSSVLPTAFPEFDLGQVVKIGADASVAGPAAHGGVIKNISWSVHDRKTPAGAKSFVSKTSKVLFSRNAATVTLRGLSAYFGTDGTKFATISFVRGRFAFEVLATVQGAAPASAKSELVKAANAFPATPIK